MDRNLFMLNFSQRLKQILQKEGYGTEHSKAGIDINKLADISGCSYQMARKYALAQALPDLPALFKIATTLNISAAWLLFGDDSSTLPKQRTDATIEIESDVLKYILNKCATLFSSTDDKSNIVNFIVDTVYDASHLNTDKKTIYKIIDMMVSSATLFKDAAKDGQLICNSQI